MNGCWRSRAMELDKRRPKRGRICKIFTGSMEI